MTKRIDRNKSEHVVQIDKDASGKEFLSSDNRLLKVIDLICIDVGRSLSKIVQHQIHSEK